MSSKLLKVKKRTVVDEDQTHVRGSLSASRSDRTGGTNSSFAPTGRKMMGASGREDDEAPRQKQRTSLLRGSLPAAGGLPKLLLHEMATKASAGQFPWKLKRPLF